MKSEILNTETSTPTDLVTPSKIDASSIVGCKEIAISVGTMVNPDYKDGGSEAKYIEPGDLVEKLVKVGWIVARVMCYSDSSTNYGHEPAIFHKTVVLLVKIK
jgi:hypothetical protein